MVISNTKAKSVYEANGERREWELGFDFDSNVSKLNIILEDAEGYQTIVEDNYLIEDGVVIYPSLESELDPIKEGYKIILFRSTPNTQEIDLRDNVTEKGLDKLTLQVQELSEQVDRAVKVPLVEEGVKEYQDLVLKVREERDSALEQIKEATSVVSDYTQASALNAVTSKEEADRAVEAGNVSVRASYDAEAFAIKAENLANEATNAVSAYVNGLGAMRNAVIDLGLFEDNQRKSSSCIIDFDFEPLDVFIRFTDSSKNMWINGAHSFAGIEKVGYRKYKIFYSVSSEDFASQSTIKGPFYVQYVIKYSVFSGKPVMYRGRVDTVDQLPAEAEDGDLWYVGHVEQENKEEYVWHAGKWELLGNTNTGAFYTKEEIDNKVMVIDSAIDANADAIQKTRNDFIEADSELQQQINAHAEELTTHRNDIDELGDEVSEIESKIPADTSDTNQLVNSQQLLKEEMELREDLNEGLSELQTQITAQASAISSIEDNVENIDKVIPDSATESNQLVTGQDLLNATQDVRADFAEADSELQTQINGQASAIANKVDVTGDTMTGALNLPELNVATSEGTLNLSITAGVATIATNNGLDIVSQTKFDTAPTTDDNTTWADALDTALVRKAQVATAIAEAGGGASVPDNVYTQDNLIAGKNVTFTEVPPEGGIDEHTLACWHCDEGTTDTVSSLALGTNVKTSTSYYKFGVASAYNNTGYILNIANSLSASSDWTIDFWAKPSSNTVIVLGRGTYSGSYQAFSGANAKIYKNSVQVYSGYSYSSSSGQEISLSRDISTFTHYAFQRKSENLELFVNGQKIIQQNIAGVGTEGNFGVLLVVNTATCYFDEIRVSDTARYTEDFTPPTKAYTVATGPSKTAVNAVIPTKTSELENDSGFLTGLPDNVYTQSNLLGGKDIEIIPEPVEGGIDEHTIAVWHFDGNTNWVDDRGVEYPSDFTYQQVYLDSTYSKFGNGSASGPNYVGARIDPATLQANYGMKRANRNESFTIDWWSLWVSASSGSYFTAKMGFVGSNYGFEIVEDIRYIANVENKINIRTAGVEQSAKFDATAFGAEYGKWVHKALEYDCSGDTAVARLYINGHIAATIEGIEKSATEMGTFQFGYGATEYFDEVRISKTARYKGVDFSDSLPTKAYTVAEPTGNMVVNFVGESGGAFDFQGTEAEFNAAVEAGKITDNTVSLVTDDNSGELVATKAELATVDATKADTALSNVLANIDYVVESKFPTADDPTWYRKYKSGWVEQGGQVLSLNNGAATSAVAFPISFVDTNYTLTFGAFGTGFNAGEANFRCTAYSEMGATFYNNSGTAITYKWYACGQGA